ncbi:MCE family protein [Mycolicibacterium litorale]|uniref:Virulence factor Mce family protein n=1 Tax=Mycolicibacterium litorale TaxID=758802 RepID=A0AAD1ILY7_9MYCO|nr:MCE family protein [Mycolicibacterium litorale]MCV7417086.1 MCE family protein [Mycolicibacterium litorale]TDY04873.1 virulence factor Mce-like protein [Mycolicibacterium litorale]BBY18302.1 virulence factor Mce family protein [Mycolicibacterium litorale]
MKSISARNVAGTLTVVCIAATVAVAVGLFNGSFTRSATVTVVSDRVGLVMNPDAKVKLHGAQVGKVAAIEALPDGRAAIQLAMDPSQLAIIPSNVLVNIGSTTVFGSKAVELVPPAEPSSDPLRAGQVLDAGHVTVEINTIFEQLVAVLAKIEPAKLNETLGALSQGLAGRGEKFGQTLADLDTLLADLDPSMDNLSRDIAVAPQVLNAYADAAPDLLATADNASRISDTLVERQSDLDALLVSAIGLADVGNDVVATNRGAFADVMRLLVPTLDLTNQYHTALNCGLAGMLPLAMAPPPPVPGVLLLDSFVLGTERYRYPQNLPKVAARGGPQCVGLPDVGYETRAPYVVSDIDANPAQYGNQGILLNSEGLKQMLFGPLDGPPRNTAQIGQPG